MKITFKQNWKEYNRGDILDLNITAAQKLINRGIARLYDKKRDELRETLKQIDKAPRDKMMRGAVKTK